MKKHLRRLGSLLAALVLLLTMAVPAHAAKASIAFTLTDEYGSAVSGAVVGLYAPGGNDPIEERTTTSNGLVSFSGIDPGSYVLAVTTFPTGYEEGPTTSHSFTVNDSGSVVQDREPADALRLRRAKHTKSYPLYDTNGNAVTSGGAIFNITGNGAIDNIECASGSLELSLAAGTYTMTNVKAPEGYELCSGSITITVDTQGNYTFSKNPSDFFRFPLTKFSFNFTKVDDGGSPVPGAVFRLTGPGLNTTATSNSNGVVTFAGLSATTNSNSYVLTEESAPAGYTKANATITVSVGTDGSCTFSEAPATAFINNRSMHSFSFVKRDDLGKPLSGAVFQLVKENGDGDDTKFTARSEVPSGRVYFKDIPHGIYVLTETTPPEGFSASTKKVTVIVSANGAVSFSEEPSNAFISNRSRFSFSFTAKAEDGTTLGKSVYTLTKDRQSIKATALSDGTVTFKDLLPGKYILEQTSVPAGYTRSKATVTVTVKEDGTVTFSDPIEALVEATISRYTIAFDKLDESGNAVEGASFRLTGENVTKDVKSTSSGRVSFTGLLAGTFTLSEVSAPAGYTRTTRTVTVTVSSTGEVTYSADPGVTFVNTRSVYGFDFLTKEDSGNPLRGAVFSLTREGEVDRTDTSSRTGRVQFDELPFGEYVLQQVSAPEGYTKSPVIVKVTISSDGKFTFEALEGLPEGRLPSLDNVFISMSGPLSFSFEAIGDDLRPLDDAIFQLRNQSTGLVSTTRSIAGVAVYYGVEAGEYTLTQSDAPTPYTASDDSYRIQVEKSGAITIWRETSAQSAAPSAAIAALAQEEGEEPTPTPAPTPDPTVPIYQDELPDGETKFIQAVSFMSKRDRNTVSLRLTDRDSGQPVSGAVFQLSATPDGEQLDMLVTGEDGIAHSMALLPGDYYVKPRTAPLGYEIVAPEGYWKVTVPEFAAPETVEATAVPLADTVDAPVGNILDAALDFARNNTVGIAVGGVGVVLLAALVFLLFKR